MIYEVIIAPKLSNFQVLRNIENPPITAIPKWSNDHNNPSFRIGSSFCGGGATRVFQKNVLGFDFDLNPFISGFSIFEWKIKVKLCWIGKCVIEKI